MLHLLVNEFLHIRLYKYSNILISLTNSKPVFHVIGFKENYQHYMNHCICYLLHTNLIYKAENCCNVRSNPWNLITFKVFRPFLLYVNIK